MPIEIKTSLYLKIIILFLIRTFFISDIGPFFISDTVLYFINFLFLITTLTGGGDLGLDALKT